MTLHALFISIALAGVSFVATAGNPDQAMGSISAARLKNVAECTPPNGNMRHACDHYDRWLRANFSLREIGMLFGCQSAYPGYITGGVDRLQRRYEILLRQYVVTHSTIGTASTVSR